MIKKEPLEMTIPLAKGSLTYLAIPQGSSWTTEK